MSSFDPKKYTLLIVEDEPDLREILVFQFQRDGFKVLEAGNGKDAFEIAKTQKVDLVISDVQMQGGNGIELLNNMRDYNHELPVVLFITGFADVTIEDAFDMGAEAVFAKPFDRKVLLETVILALSPKDERWKARPWRGETLLPMEITLEGFEAARAAQLVNIGRGGIFVAMNKDIPPVGKNVFFKIQFQEGHILSIEGQGVVRWVRSNAGNFPPGCGIEFVGLTPQAQSQVAELINFLKTKQFIPKI